MEQESDFEQRQLQLRKQDEQYFAARYRRLQPGMQAPDWSAQAVVDFDMKTVSSLDYRGKYLVLFFYPLDL